MTRVNQPLKPVAIADFFNGIGRERMFTSESLTTPKQYFFMTMHIANNMPETLARLRTHSQNSTVAARAMADRKTVGHRSYRVATRRQSFRRPNMISMRLRLLYRRLS